MPKLIPRPWWWHALGAVLIGAALGLLWLRSHQPPPPPKLPPPPQLPISHVELQPHSYVFETMDSFYASLYGISEWEARRIRRHAQRERIPTPIALHLVWVESRFKRTALSHAGARGLTQVMPRTGLLHCDLHPSQLYHADPNLACGLSYLRMLQDRYANWRTSLAAYNVGPGRLVVLRNIGARYATLVLSSSSN